MSSLIVPPRRGFFGGGYPNLLTVKIIPIRTTVLGNGQNDLYTVPTGKRASISYTVTNESGGAINHTFQIKISGTYYTFVATASVINNTTGIQSNALNTCPIAEAGA